MNPLAIIPGRLLAALFVTISLVGTIWWLNVDRRHWREAYQALEASEIAAAKVHQGELHAAHDTHVSEVATDRRDADVAPIVLRLRLNAPAVLAGCAPGAAAGATAGDIQPVPAGDPGRGPRREGPDIGPLLSALALKADLVSADLREQQSVR